MKKTILSAAALFGLTFAGTALAQGLDFNALDTDLDGEISFEELQVVFPNLSTEDFNSLDVDGSGGLSVDEFQVLLQVPEQAPAPDAPFQ